MLPADHLYPQQYQTPSVLTYNNTGFAIPLKQPQSIFSFAEVLCERCSHSSA